MISEQIDELLKKKKEIEAQAGITSATTTEESIGLAEDLARDFAPDFVFTIIDHMQSSSEGTRSSLYSLIVLTVAVVLDF